jgi:hypothetical protein
MQTNRLVIKIVRNGTVEVGWWNSGTALVYLLNLENIHKIRPITTTISIIAVQKPALKMPSTNSHEVRIVDNASAIKNK